jgi:hypothetical protein
MIFLQRWTNVASGGLSRGLQDSKFATSDRWQLRQILSEVRIIMERKKRRIQKPDKFSTQKGWSRFRRNGYAVVGDEALLHNSNKEQRT